MLDHHSISRPALNGNIMELRLGRAKEAVTNSSSGDIIEILTAGTELGSNIEMYNAGHDVETDDLVVFFLDANLNYIFFPTRG